MEAGQKLTNGFKTRQLISSSEKKCKKCGFATLSLHVLYSHQRKCQGTLLTSMSCCHCGRKFSRLLLFRQHKKTCLKSREKKRVLKRKLVQKKLKVIRAKSKPKKSEKPVKEVPALLIPCPKCRKSFPSQSEYDAHAKKGLCSLATSARKSVPNAKGKTPVKMVGNKEPPESKKDSVIQQSEDESEVSCNWCKNVYPNENILAQHLERNSRCALAHRQARKPEPVEHTARKSMPNSTRFRPMEHSARKSLSNHHQRPPRFDPRSARKSFGNSASKRYKVDPSPLKSLNQCPVCYQKIPDPYKFLQHQKKLNHWGRATKSMNSVCKCPFCRKQFFHVRSLHAHVRSHTNKSEREKEAFFRKTTCPICAQIFISEVAKYQHTRYFHSKSEAAEVTDVEMECQFCPQLFGTAEGLETHMQDAHYDEFKFECVVCKINLATSSQVVLHCTKVHSKQSPEKIIRRRSDASPVEAPGFELPMPVLTMEVDRTGTNELYCDICDLHFQKKAGLQSHRLTKLHKDTLVKSLDTMRESINELPSPKRAPKVQKETPAILTCSECSEDFTAVKDFVPHRLSHFGRGKYMKINDFNRYKCEICDEVCSSHSKVQMHLFWHLQVESTASDNVDSAAKDKGKATDPIVPDRLSGQTVAKKSFSKPAADSQNEIVIGGKKKSLFTCENCGISFTTQAHYSLHVRKLCKKKAPEEKSVGPVSAGGSKMMGRVTVEKKNIKFCSICNTLYDSSIKSVHDELCKKCVQKRLEVKKNVAELLKTGMVRQNKVACCIPCSQLFGNSNVFRNHMLTSHKVAENSMSEQEAETLKESKLCTSCKFLFLSTSAREAHEPFCKDASYHDFDEESSREILEPFSDTKDAIAICIRCNEAFSDIKTLKKHLVHHKVQKKKSTNGPTSSNPSDEESPLIKKSSVPGLLDDLSMVVNPDEDTYIDLTDDPLADLRDNFSQLFCILINDASLMQDLGYGELPVEEVLVNVLQQMSQVPVTEDEEESDLERFRKNIRIFLDFSLKDQVLKLIESGTESVDALVVEALKTLNTNEVMDISREMDE